MALVSDVGWTVYARMLRLAALPFRWMRDPDIRIERTLHTRSRLGSMEDSALVARLEGVEAEAWADAYDALVASRGPLGPAVSRTDTLVAVRLAAMDAPLFNRALWRGDGDPSKDTTALVSTLERFFDGVGVGDYRVQVAPAVGSLDVEGFERVGQGWGKFRWPGGRPRRAETELRMGRVDAARREDFVGVVAAGFGFPPQLRSWLETLPGRTRWSTYVAYDGPTPIGAGASFIDGKAAWLGFGATLPAARRRGAQGALLARRVADALDAGATTICTETGAPDAQGPGPSWRNIERVGFELAYIRPNWRRVR